MRSPTCCKWPPSYSNPLPEMPENEDSPTAVHTATDWAAVAPTVRPGETAEATWRTFTIGDLPVRSVEYTPGYLTDH